MLKKRIFGSFFVITAILLIAFSLKGCGGGNTTGGGGGTPEFSAFSVTSVV